MEQDEAPNLRKLAAKSLNESCKRFLGNDSQCDLFAESFEKGEITFDAYLDKMNEVFSLHTPVPKKEIAPINREPMENEEEKES